MNILRAFSFCQLVALGLIVSSTLHANEWRLTFSITEEKSADNPPPEPGPPAIRTYTQTVTLGDHFLVIQDDHLKRIYDFSEKRAYQVGLGANPVNTYSPLHGEVGWLDDEIRIRMAGSAGLRAAKVKSRSPVFDRFETESALRIPALTARPDNPEPVIEQTALSDGTVFTYAGRTVVRFVPAKEVLPPSLRSRFTNYLAYACAIHPKIRQTISATGALPAELVFVWHDGKNRVTVTQRLVSTEASGSDGSVHPPTSRPALGERDPFGPIFSGVLEAERTRHRATRAETIAFVEKALSAGNILDARLALKEFELETGVELTAELQKHRAVFDRDAQCSLYAQGFIQVNQPTPDALEKSLASNARIDRSNLQKSHLLELQRASLLDRLGRRKEAEELYLSVLRAHPLLTAALSDLGLFYACTAQQTKAWLCWETALRVHPDHPFLQKVKGYGLRFEKAYPDFY